MSSRQAPPCVELHIVTKRGQQKSQLKQQDYPHNQGRLPVLRALSIDQQEELSNSKDPFLSAKVRYSNCNILVHEHSDIGMIIHMPAQQGDSTSVPEGQPEASECLPALQQADSAPFAFGAVFLCCEVLDFVSTSSGLPTPEKISGIASNVTPLAFCSSLIEFVFTFDLEKSANFFSTSDANTSSSLQLSSIDSVFLLIALEISSITCLVSRVSISPSPFLDRSRRSSITPGLTGNSTFPIRTVIASDDECDRTEFSMSQLDSLFSSLFPFKFVPASS
nr:hypothetical protein Iba_chr07aCG0020 [Ipomoea batatas]